MPQYTLKIFGNKTFTNKLQAPKYMNDAVATMEGFFAYEDGAHKENETDADFGASLSRAGFPSTFCPLLPTACPPCALTFELITSVAFLFSHARLRSRAAAGHHDARRRIRRV